MSLKKKHGRLPHLAGKGSIDVGGADTDASMAGAGFPKVEPEPEDLEFIGSYGFLYAGYEPHWTGDYADMGAWAGDKARSLLSGNYAVRAT